MMAVSKDALPSSDANLLCLPASVIKKIEINPFYWTDCGAIHFNIFSSAIIKVATVAK